MAEAQYSDRADEGATHRIWGEPEVLSCYSGSGSRSASSAAHDSGNGFSQRQRALDFFTNSVRRKVKPENQKVPSRLPTPLQEHIRQEVVMLSCASSETSEMPRHRNDEAASSETSEMPRLRNEEAQPPATPPISEASPPLPGFHVTSAASAPPPISEASPPLPAFHMTSPASRPFASFGGCAGDANAQVDEQHGQCEVAGSSGAGVEPGDGSPVDGNDSQALDPLPLFEVLSAAVPLPKSHTRQVKVAASQRPAQVSAEQPSALEAGVDLHSLGECKPCLYLNSKLGCLNGQTCRFCHMPHPKKNRPRPCKATRMQCKQIAYLLNSFSPDPKRLLQVTEELGAKSTYMRTLLKDKQKQLEQDIQAQQYEEREEKYAGASMPQAAGGMQHPASSSSNVLPRMAAGSRGGGLPSQADARKKALSAACTSVTATWYDVWNMFSPEEVKYFKAEYPAKQQTEGEDLEPNTKVSAEPAGATVISYKEAMETVKEVDKKEVLCLTLFTIDDECVKWSYIRMA